MGISATFADVSLFILIVTVKEKLGTQRGTMDRYIDNVQCISIVVILQYHVSQKMLSLLIKGSNKKIYILFSAHDMFQE
jgi:hypothetical protein